MKSLISREEKRKLAQAALKTGTIDELTARQQTVIRMRYGSDTIPSAKDVAEDLGITRARLYQLESDAILRLQNESAVNESQSVKEERREPFRLRVQGQDQYDIAILLDTLDDVEIAFKLIDVLHTAITNRRKQLLGNRAKHQSPTPVH